MPHQCVRCNKFHLDGAMEILKGCSCGGRLFFYIKKEKLEQSKKEIEQVSTLSSEQKLQIEQDVSELLGKKIDEDQTVVLDFESVRIMGPGKYELDLVKLFNGEPIIYKLEDGKYVVDLAQSFEAFAKKKREELKK